MASNGYSARVSLRLVVAGHSFELSHVGSGGLIVRDDCGQLSECNGDLIIKVGERETKKSVFLPNGIPGARCLVPFF